jgi:cytidine deaminase
MDYKLLAEKALEATKSSPPYLILYLGRLTEDNKIYLGCNIEISSYKLQFVQRNAISKLSLKAKEI